MRIFLKYELSLFQNMGMPCEAHHYPTPTYSFTGGWHGAGVPPLIQDQIQDILGSRKASRPTISMITTGFRGLGA